ncbi:MAG: hypothetical protein HC878_19070 [Leptolyngbyaceae cyanobacterium SL_5_14]|nr:hypothetical protein [Leptolyngbyaceae cyanobacterium SL_5_14]
MTAYQFQIVANAEEVAQQFIQAAGAEDASVEEWEYNVGTPEHKQECYGFGLTHLSPKRLQYLADQMGVALVYANNKAEIDQEDDKLVQRVLKAREIVAAMNLASEQEILHQMFETYRHLSEEAS